MTKYLFLAAACACILFRAVEVLGEDVLLPTDFRTEQVYLAPERTIYRPGDTIRVQGQVTCLANDRVLPYSRYLYVELISNSERLVARQMLSCGDRGYFTASFLTDTLSTDGTYYLRGYTRLMRNFSDRSFGQQAVLISSTGRLPERDETVRCAVGVEGGVLLPDMLQNVTAALTDRWDRPIAGREIYLTDSRGDTVARGVSSAAGYAVMGLVPSAGRSYEITVPGTVDEVRVALPPVATDGVKIMGALSGRRLKFEIVGSGELPDSAAIYLFDRNNGLARLDAQGRTGTVTLGHAPDMVTLFLADSRGFPLAEYTMEAAGGVADAGLTLTGEQPGEPIRFELTDGGRKDAKVIARIVPYDTPYGSDARQSLRYEADYGSELPYPGGEATDSERRAWLGTARFKRFALNEVALLDTAIYRYLPEFNMGFSGAVYNTARRPYRSGTLVAFDGSSYIAYEGNVDGEGRWRVETDDYADGTEFFLQTVTSKGKVEWSDIRIDDETYPPVRIERRVRERQRLIASGVNIGEEVEGSHKLPDVVVKARANVEKPKSSAEFYGVRMKNRETIEKRHYRNLYDIIRDIPFLKIKQTELVDNGGKGHGDDSGDKNQPVDKIDNYEWIIVSNRSQFSIGKHASDGVALVIDGTKCERYNYNLWFEMPAMDIESVEYISPAQALAYVAYAPEGAVMVKTRKAGPPEPKPSKGTLYRAPGLTVSRMAGNAEPVVPTSPGRYRLIVDVTGEDGVRSYVRTIEVE